VTHHRTPEGDAFPVTSVWATCQQPAHLQRRGRYVKATRAHPAKMLPAVAAHVIATYTDPGDLVLDPMCGSGTTLVEAVHAGRHALGVDIEPGFAALAATNLALAHSQGATGTARVIHGDATHLDRLLPGDMRGQVALVLTSPPYGPVTHGLVTTTPGQGLEKEHQRYGPGGNGNLAYTGWNRLLDGFTEIMTACHDALRPGGIVAITVRPVRHHRDDFTDLPSQILSAAMSAGLEPVERCVALLAAVRGDRLQHRASLFALLAARRARTDGIPLSLVAHEDVVILRRTPTHSDQERIGSPLATQSPPAGRRRQRAACLESSPPAPVSGE
jgi:SAM-dependent methyltransferase